MNIFIDTEFNSFGGELISLALVAEDGDEFYEVLPYQQLDIHPWVDEHVIPVLNQEPIDPVIFQSRLQFWLSKYDNVHIIADWPEDIGHFCDALITGPGMRLDTPPLTMEVLRIEAPSNQPHNALSDARGLRSEYNLG